MHVLREFVILRNSSIRMLIWGKYAYNTFFWLILFIVRTNCLHNELLFIWEDVMYSVVVVSMLDWMNKFFSYLFIVTYWVLNTERSSVLEFTCPYNKHYVVHGIKLKIINLFVRENYNYIYIKWCNWMWVGQFA